MITELFPAQSMSCEIASSTSPTFIENMLPLDVLAAVASQTLRNEITPPTSREKISSENKKWFRKSVYSDHFTLDEIKALPTKSLVLKFSEMTSDELTKKYSYKCMLIPEKCTVIYKSFGNEKKAYDKIKDHLLHHVAHLMNESEFKGRKNKFFTSVPLFHTKSTEKFPKRSVKVQKKHQALLTKVLPNTESRTVFKTTKRKSTYVVNKLKKKFSKDFPSLNHFDARKIEKTVAKKETNNTFSFDVAEKKSKKPPQQKSVYKKLNTSVDASPSTANSSYNKFTPIQKEDKSESNVQMDPSFDALYEACVSVYDDIATKEKMEQEIEQETGTSLLKSNDFKVSHDHTYAATDEAKKNEKLALEAKKCASETQNFVAGVKRFTVPSQLIIKTPPFPFVHTPLLPDLAEIKEIGLHEVQCTESMLQYEGDSVFAEAKVKLEKLSDEESRVDSASGTVLECVENRVNVKQLNSISSKNSFTAAENDENLENMQKCERELALKYIAKLYAKKKKQSNGSLLCQICKDKYFTAQATLIHHYRSHAGIKPYLCNICSSTFTRQHSLNYHMLIHQNLSRFTCAHCSRTFRHPSHYKEHLRRHTGEAPFHCRDCDLHFKTRNTFKRHLRTRHQKLLTSHGLKDMSSDSSP